MPFPNFHAARIREPGLFKQIRVLQTLSNGIMLYGGNLKSDPGGKTVTQSYRFPVAEYTAEQAKAWLREHKIKVLKFEPAIKKAGSDNFIREYLKSILGASQQVSKEPDNIRLKVLEKDADGCKLGYAVNGGKPRKDNNLTKIASHPDQNFRVGETLEIQAEKVHPVFTGDICGLHLEGLSVVKSLGFKSCDSTVEILEKAIRLGICESDEQDFEKLKTLGLIKTDLRKSDFSKEIKLIKDTKKQIVYGVVYEPFDGSNIDHHGDYMTKEEIEKMAHTYAEDYGKISDMHEREMSDNEASMVETFIAPIDFRKGGQLIKEGSWVMAVHVKNADYWDKIESGEINAFSIEGTGKQGADLI